MKTLNKITLLGLTCLVFSLAACDQERDKASLHDSADTLHTDNAKHKYEDGALQSNADSTDSDKDSSTRTEQADPTGRVNEQQ